MKNCLRLSDHGLGLPAGALPPPHLAFGVGRSFSDHAEAGGAHGQLYSAEPAPEPGLPLVPKEAGMV
jgi:hypothetical protein